MTKTPEELRIHLVLALIERAVGSLLQPRTYFTIQSAFKDLTTAVNYLERDPLNSPSSSLNFSLAGNWFAPASCTDPLSAYRLTSTPTA